MEVIMNNRSLETEPLPTLMKQYAVPCVISLLVGALYNIVDQIFIANAPYLGSYGNAANTVVFPFTVIALAIAVMIGDGCGTFFSMSLGAEETEKAEKAVGSAVVMTVCMSLLLTAVFLIFKDRLLAFFGAGVNEQTFAYSREYFFWIVLGIPFYMFGQGLNPIIRSDGSPKHAMTAVLAGSLTNVVLDPLFIYTFHWGMSGAAAATVIGQIVTAVLTARYFLHMNHAHLTFRNLQFHPDFLRSCLPLGITSFLAQISLVASMAAVNRMTAYCSLLDPVFGNPQLSQIPIAVLGIVMKFFQIVISIVVGTAAGCAPIGAYNIGAQQYGRVRNLFLLLLKTEALVGLAAFLITELFPHQLIGIFGAGNESVHYTEFAVRAFRIYLFMIVPACVNKATFIFLQASGKAFLSSAVSMFREIVLGVALPILLPMKYGLDGILYSMPLADIITFAVTLVLIRQILQELDQKAMMKSKLSLSA